MSLIYYLLLLFLEVYNIRFAGWLFECWQTQLAWSFLKWGACPLKWWNAFGNIQSMPQLIFNASPLLTWTWSQMLALQPPAASIGCLLWVHAATSRTKMSLVHHDLVVVNPCWQPSQPICLVPALSSSVDCCCHCMNQSTCKTHKWHCVQAGIPYQSCHCSNKCCNHATNSKFTISVPPTAKLGPQTAEVSQPLDPSVAGLTTAALPLTSTDPAAPPAPPPPPEPTAAPLRPGDLPNTPYRHQFALGYGLWRPCPCQSRHPPVRDISNDPKWQTYLQWLIVYPSQQYDLPNCSIGKHF